MSSGYTEMHIEPTDDGTYHAIAREYDHTGQLQHSRVVVFGRSRKKRPSDVKKGKHQPESRGSNKNQKYPENNRSTPEEKSN